jgi:hypothetical protein
MSGTLVIEIIGRTWDRQFAQNPSQPDGPLKGAGGYIHILLNVTRSQIVLFEPEFLDGLRICP